MAAWAREKGIHAYLIPRKEGPSTPSALRGVFFKLWV
jgi:hypothetical protein